MEWYHKDSFSHQYYNPTEVILGKQMREWLPFSISWWHNLGSQSMKGNFAHSSGILYEIEKAELAFQFMEKLNIDFFCFQGAGCCGAARNLVQAENEQKQLNSVIREKMEVYHKKLLWGSSNYISLPQTELGAATSPSLDVFWQSLALEKVNVDTVLALNGIGIMFWGGKEGYRCVADTDFSLELDNRAEHIKKTIAYAKEKGFKGKFYLEPKPKRPGRYQYHFDVATATLFLKQYHLEEMVSLCLDPYHASLAGHNFDYEVRMAKIYGMIGTIDISPDRFLDSDKSYRERVKEWTLIMCDLISMGGIKNGGINFDPKDYGTIYTQDSILKSLYCAQEILAWSFRAAAWLEENKLLEDMLHARYEQIRQKNSNYNMEQIWDQMKNKSVTLDAQYYTEDKVNKLLEQAIEAVSV